MANFQDIFNFDNDHTKFWLTEQLRKIIKEERKNLDLTQGELAEKIGKDTVYISNCESGRRRMDFIEVMVFLDALDIDVTELINNLDIEKAKERDYGPYQNKS
jgi:ribosome-binding protein aMBF1 (putative translation factor)